MYIQRNDSHSGLVFERSQKVTDNIFTSDKMLSSLLVCFFFLTTNKTSGVCVSVRIHSQNKTNDGKCSALLETHRRCHLHEADEMPRVCEAESKATGVIKI